MSNCAHVEPFVRPLDPPVRGFLHLPAGTATTAIILTHGAGSNAQAPLLVALAECFCANGFTVLRCDLPYRQVRVYGPPGPGDAARDRAGLKNAVIALREMGIARIVMGGHSYGGRQASMLCAEAPDLATALLLLSYPLHPPRKPEQLRTQHFTDLRTPTLFVSGTKDPFGLISEIEQTIKQIPGKTKLFVLEGAGHDLGFKGKARRQDLPAGIMAAFREFLG
ncbi:MAG TPA: alpha/beta family hydrolase [Candidatus Acidoferrales bacterium]